MKKDFIVKMSFDDFTYLCTFVFLAVGALAFLVAGRFFQTRPYDDLQRMAAKKEKSEYADCFKMQLNPVHWHYGDTYYAFFPTSETAEKVAAFDDTIEKERLYQSLLFNSDKLSEYYGIPSPGLREYSLSEKTVFVLHSFAYVPDIKAKD